MIATKAIRIADATPLGGYRLRIRWTGGANSEVDLQAFVHRYKGLKPLRERRRFAKARPGEGGHSLVWPGDLDIGADRLWELALEQNGRHDAAEFLRWRWRHGLSLSAAAAALGLSRRTVAYYANASHPVPRTVLLACKGWELEQTENRRDAA